MYLPCERMHDYDQDQYCQYENGKQITIQKIRTLWRLFTILFGGHKRIGLS